MVLKIKDYLRQLVKEITNIEDKKIFLEAKDENQYLTPDWVSILTASASSEKSLQMDMIDEETNILYRKQYGIEQPILLSLASKENSNIDKWVYEILQKIAHKIELNNQIVLIDVKNIDYSDTESSIRNIYVATIKMLFSYGVYSETKLTNEFSEIKVTI